MESLKYKKSLSPKELQEKELVFELIKLNKIKIVPIEEISLIEIIGKGGQAVVYKAEYNNDIVAVKFFKKIDYRCFAHELVIYTNFKHKNIPLFYGLVSSDEHGIGLINEFISGKSLNEINLESLEEKTKLKIMLNIAEALEYIHTQGLVHRDLKPDNIMVTEKNYIYVIDFGIAKVMHTGDSLITRAKGTLNYLAPETLEEIKTGDKGELISSINSKVDIWAFGCILSYIFSAIKPWTNKYQDNSSFIYKALTLKKEFPIPVEEIRSKNKNFDIIIKIIEQCTYLKEKERPEISEIVLILKKLI
jgi:serine/threonine protein kinase